MLIVAVAAALGAERLVERLFRTIRQRLARRAGPDDGPPALARLLGIALIDGLALGAVFVVSNALVGAWFSVDDVQSASPSSSSPASSPGVFTCSPSDWCCSPTCPAHALQRCPTATPRW